jgi:crotonobetainyl-CoA:carnitine CoA-transferase CaiB-like acyl-CoA transferase
MASSGPLSGLRVVEVGQYIAAPFAATLFADQGADVTKIERPGGDPYRRHAAAFAAWNRGKTSVTIDLSTSRGRSEALALIEGADVVIENLRPGALARLGLPLHEMRAGNSRLVTCSISAFGSTGPARDEPGWEPLVHARAGAQQGLVTGDRPVWSPFPLASVGAAFLAVLGTGAALVKRETTGYGQHVETSLLDAMLFLNAGAVFHRDRARPAVVRLMRSPVLGTYPTRDGRAIQVNLSGTERWRELCRVVGIDGDGGLDFSNPKSLAKLGDRAWTDRLYDEIAARFATLTADEWEEVLLQTPAAAAKCNTLGEWLAHEQVRANNLVAETGLVAPPIRMHAGQDERAASRPRSAQGGALAGHRVVDLSSFWAGPLASRLLAELGADVIKVEPPGGEGAYHLAKATPNIYMDGNRSKRGITLDLRSEEDRRRLLELVRAADVVVENARAGTWEKLGLDEARLRSVNPDLLYARVKGFGLHGPLASRPAFDFVLQAATGMEMTQGAGQPQPVNFTTLDYGTGLHLAVGAVLALLARARGENITSVDASLMMTATVFQAEHIAQIALDGRDGADVSRDLEGPTPWCHLYAAEDGWLAVCAVTPEQQAGLRRAFALDELSVRALAGAIGGMTVEKVRALLRADDVPSAVSVHPGAVPDDDQVRDRDLLVNVRHPVKGHWVQVGVPLRLSADMPAVKSPAPNPGSARGTATAR